MLIYQNMRNSTGMNFNKKKPSKISEFTNKDIRSISVPFNATKSSENIGKPRDYQISDQKRAQTTDKFGPRQKFLPKIGLSTTNTSSLLQPDKNRTTNITTMNVSEHNQEEPFPEGEFSDLPMKNSRN
jgi:hypothetical protein